MGKVIRVFDDDEEHCAVAVDDGTDEASAGSVRVGSRVV